MKPLYKVFEYIDKTVIYISLLNDVHWLNKDAPRNECFMSEVDRIYTYGKGFERTYNSVKPNFIVKNLMTLLNYNYNTDYNVCFLNHYVDQHQHLGWHSDDSPEQDPNHPIAVVSFGAAREIWIREKGFKGPVLEENKYLLEDGSLFIMPVGFQEKYQHRIPKNDRPCGGRISLTFRRFI